MYHFSYAEVLDENPKEMRARERQALERSIDLLRKAETAGVNSREAIEANAFSTQLWTILVEDLGMAENQLPKQLRADLVSIGLWVLRELEDMRMDRSQNYKGVIEVTQSISVGLA
jgi:flagellar protein FlaF